MKAEERHRLHENDLRRFAEQARERARPVLDRFGATILFFCAAAIIIVAIAVWWFKSVDQSDAGAWADLAQAMRNPQATAEDFANIADTHEYAETTPAKWARLLEAEARLDSGLQLLFTDRQAALRELEQAKKGFQALREGAAVSPEHEVRVRFGLAKVLEVTSGDDLQPAIKAYEAVAKDYPGTVYARLASVQREELQTKDAQSFYAWFSKQTPEPADPLQRPDDALAAPGNAVTSPESGAASQVPASPETTAPVVAPRPSETP